MSSIKDKAIEAQEEADMEQLQAQMKENFISIGEEAAATAETAEVSTELTTTEESSVVVIPQETAYAPVTTAYSIWTNSEMLTTVQRAGKLFAASEIAPQAYRGKLADCVIAIDMANRMGVSPLVIMQSSQIVYGNFSWKGTACKAMIDACGKYASTRYVEVGKRGDDSWGYYLEAIDKRGNTVKGVTVDVAMAKAEGWYKRNPKWQTMTELMLKYRCAAFFMRTECAGIGMGFLSAEEHEDIGK